MDNERDCMEIRIENALYWYLLSLVLDIDNLFWFYGSGNWGK